MATTDDPRPLPIWPDTVTMSVRSTADRFTVARAGDHDQQCWPWLRAPEAALYLTGLGLTDDQAAALIECARAMGGRTVFVRADS